MPESIPSPQSSLRSRVGGSTVRGGYLFEACLPWLTEGNDLIRVAFETVVVADDEELLKVLDAADLLGQIPPSLLVHVRRGLVEERDVDLGKFFKQRQPHRQRGGHLLSA